ncbi:FtsX-like permease family protein [Paenibacillus pasadenensis]|uniref:FtsX-like permease family protein n=1 Tax=Paenibacillus pasadenensis TaxID=217090 RepID=UPI00203E8AEE|nr:FtsX-like permease family protein [Paenibacillus pasadenensis]MCM3748193.1 FtsX-like permease family protein [Paenibacillus pasadenensis]
MTFRSLALNNIRGNWRSYAAYFLSSVFSVFIFYLYASFVLHPDVTDGKIIHAQGVTSMMKACMYLIIIFSFFFVLYSSSAFVKTRKKELGLLSLFGTTRRQLRRMVVYESMAVALLSIGSGLGLGILLSKLFIMGLSTLLDNGAPIRFAVPLQAVWLTAGSFLLLFLVISLLTAMTVGRSQIVDLLGDSRRPKQQPAYSPMLSALAVLSLGTGYVMAYFLTSKLFLLFVMPIIGLTVLGTYFLYTQLSVALIRLLQRRKGFYYRRTNMLVISQMAFRMKDNARILFVVTILSAIVMCAASTVYVFQKIQRDQIMDYSPYTVGYVEQGEGNSVMAPAEAEKLLHEGGARIAEKTSLQGLLVEKLQANELGWSEENSITAMMVPLSEYNRLAERAGYPKRTLENGSDQSASASKGSAFIVHPYASSEEDDNKGEGLAEGSVGGKPLRLNLDSSAYGSVVSSQAEATWLLVVSDGLFNSRLQDAPAEALLHFYGFELEDWENQQAAVNNFLQAVPENMQDQVQATRVSYYKDMRQTSGLTIFIGMFISVLFFIAAGSLLYFKLFTELQEDRSQFRSLKRIGLTAGELRRTIALQVVVMYLAPCLVGIVHGLFAMKALGTLLTQPVWMYGLAVMGMYVVMQSVYCFISWFMYSRSILRETAV